MALQRRWELGERDLEVLAIQSVARDVGKANSDYPTRTTVYPDERHLLASATLRPRDDWLVRAFAHPNSLDTEVEQAGSRSEVKTDALDLGVHAVRWLQLGGGARAQAGIDYLGRGWGARTEYIYRRGKDDVGSGEQILDSAELVEASLWFRVSKHMVLTVGTENLTDEKYFSSADRKSALAPGRVLFVRVDLSR